MGVGWKVHVWKQCILVPNEYTFETYMSSLVRHVSVRSPFNSAIVVYIQYHLRHSRYWGPEN